MMHSQEQHDISKDEDCARPKVFKYRWIVAAVVAVSMVVVKLMINSFGIVNNVYVTYFNMTYVEVDWFTLIQIPGNVFYMILLAFMIYAKRTGFRDQLLVITGCEIFASACLISAFVRPVLYPLIYIGQFAMGIALANVKTVAAIMAVNWFPKRELGTALSTKAVGGGLGSALASIVPSQLLISPNGNMTNSNMSLLSNNNNSHHDWLIDIRKRFLIFSVPILLVCLVLFFLGFFFINEHPPQPPNVCSESAENTRGPKQISNKLFKDLIMELRAVFQNRNFVLISLTLSIRKSIIFTQILFTAEVLRQIFHNRFSITEVNKRAGYVDMMSLFGYSVGGFASGLLHDRLKKPKLQIYCCSIVNLFGIIGLSLGYYFKSLIALMCFVAVFDGALGLSFSAYYCTLLKSTEHLSDGAIVIVFSNLISFLFSIVVNQGNRFILNYFGGISIYIIMTILCFLLNVFNIFIQSVNDGVDENTCLTQDDQNNSSSH